VATEAVLTASQMASQTSKLLCREEAAEGTMAFHFEKPSGFKFKAGQFADVALIDPPESGAEGCIGLLMIWGHIPLLLSPRPEQRPLLRLFICSIDTV